MGYFMLVSGPPTSVSTLSAVRCRRPRAADAASVHELVSECKPLDLNSPYAYLLLCTHFADTSAIAEADGMLLGFVGGYLKPGDSSVIFIWQIAVSEAARGRGVGKRLLRELLDRPGCRHVRHLETTITPSNEASWVLFRSFARTVHADCSQTTLFRSEDFGEHDHEEEQLLRIGPVHA
jgi:L-2,4-diaminobutyric acid acetyltransferase